MYVSNRVTIIGLLILQSRYCISVIILDSGNPARLVSGSFVDVNHPEFFGESIREMENNNFPVHRSVDLMKTDMVNNLDHFINTMGDALMIEVVKTDAASAVNTCRLSRARMSAMKVKNIYEANIAKAAIDSVGGEDEVESSDSLMKISDSEMQDTKIEFNQMIEDLHHYDETVHGTNSMIHFKNALKTFDSLQVMQMAADEIK